MRVFVYIVLFVSAAMTPLSASPQDLDVTKVVEAHEAYTARDSKRNRDRLLAALESYQDDATVETVRAYRAILNADIGSGRFNRIRESALATATHLEPVSDILPKLYIEAKFFAAIGLFNGRQDPDAITEMAHVQGLSASVSDDAGDRPDWATDLRWKSEAWRMAMSAYFMSIGARHPSDSSIEAILDLYSPNETPLDPSAPQPETKLPQCAGKVIQKPKLRYSAKQSFNGMYGAVILGLEFDPNGAVVNPRVLASVPVDEFDERSIAVVNKWKFEPEDPSQVGVTCRIENSSVVQPLLFSLR